MLEALGQGVLKLLFGHDNNFFPTQGILKAQIREVVRKVCALRLFGNDGSDLAQRAVGIQGKNERLLLVRNNDIDLLGKRQTKK